MIIYLIGNFLECTLVSLSLLPLFHHPLICNLIIIVIIILSLSVYTIQHNFLLIFLFSYFLPKRTIIYPLMMDLFNLNQNCLHFENINQVCSSSSDVEISSHFICLSQFCFRKTHFTRLPTQSWPFSSLFLHSSSSSSYFSLLA